VARALLPATAGGIGEARFFDGQGFD